MTPLINRYRLTPLGRRLAVLFKKAHTAGYRATPHIAKRSHLPALGVSSTKALEGFIADQMVAASEVT